MGITIKEILPNSVRDFLSAAKENREWEARHFTAPSPRNIKRRVLTRECVPHAIWIETGTFLGDTSAFLASTGSRVITIEPEPALFARAKARFAENHAIEVINGTSEEVFPRILPKLRGDLNFWLDGHFSDGVTFKGQTVSPIEAELASIEECLPQLGKLAIFVDDVRLFHPKINMQHGYPEIDVLTDWVNKHGFSWHIEHDIFIAKNF